ncbi:MAG: hypothetical protein ABIR05_02360 [Luteimonas sp.]
MLLSLRPLSSLLLLALLGASGIAVAAPQSQDPTPAATEQPRRPRSAPLLPTQLQESRRSEEALSDSVRKIERTTRSQVLTAERVPYDGRNVNRIKVIDDRGRVRVYMDDPAQTNNKQPTAPPPTRGDDD